MLRFQRNRLGPCSLTVSSWPISGRTRELRSPSVRGSARLSAPTGKVRPTSWRRWSTCPRCPPHRVASDLPLVRAGAERAILRARCAGRARRSPSSSQLEVEITPGKANRARLNKSPLGRARQLIGVLRTVVFSPEDLAIVKGDPSRATPVPRRPPHQPLAEARRRTGRLRQGASAAQHVAEVTQRAAVRPSPTMRPRHSRCGTATSPPPAPSCSRLGWPHWAIWSRTWPRPMPTSRRPTATPAPSTRHRSS